MSLGQWKAVARWGWVAAVIIFIIYYTATKFVLIKQSVTMLSPATLLIAVCAIILSKLCLSVNMRLAAGKAGLCISIKDSYCIYNLTQLAKYIPGSIWQFFGRIDILRKRGVAPAAIRDSLIIEHVWIIGSAALFGVGLIRCSRPDLIGALINKFGSTNAVHWAVIVFILLFFVLVLFMLIRKKFTYWLFRLLPSVRAVIVLSLTWFFFAIAFWVTLSFFWLAPVPFLYAFGIYCIAWVVGFLVPFAPAGLGVREGILVFAMTPFMPIETAILLAAINRVLCFLSEIIIVIPCVVKRRTFETN